MTDPFHFLSRARRSVVRFARDTEGTVTIESLMALPILMFWYIASFTFFDAFRVMNINDKAAYTLSDLISRTRADVTLNQSYINGMNTVFDYLVKYEGDTWIRITSVGWDDTNSEYTQLWSASTKSQPTLTSGDLNQADVIARLPNMKAGETIILVETSLVYNPPFNVGIQPLPYTAFIFTAPRFALSGIRYSS